jgi:starch synthase
MSPIVHISAEIAPWSRKGGLGDAVAGLSTALAAAGRPNLVWSPLFTHTRSSAPREGASRVRTPDRPWADSWMRVEDRGDRRVEFIELPFPYSFDDVHTDAALMHQEGMDPRYLMFGMVCARKLSRLPPGVCFTHDWHGGAVHLFTSLCPGWRFVHVIHNYEYHGAFSWGRQVESLLGPDLQNCRRLIGDCAPSFAAMSMNGADEIVTVSAPYAEELLSGAVPHPYLRNVKGRNVAGVLNGYDSTTWDPTTDPLIPSTFSGPGARRSRNREHLDEEFGLRPDLPLVVTVSRVTADKGFDLLTGSPPTRPAAVSHIAAVLGCEVNLIVCGEPEGGLSGALNTALVAAAAAHGPQFTYINRYDDRTGHRLLAGADILLFPSRFEPCGLVPLHALAYGVLPVVHPVGGLRATVPDNLSPDRGPVGVHIRDLSIHAVIDALTAARDAVRSQDGDRIVRRAMSQPQSWSVRKDAYLELVDRLVR